MSDIVERFAKALLRIPGSRPGVDMLDVQRNADRLAAFLRERIAAGDACAKQLEAHLPYLIVHSMWSQQGTDALDRYEASVAQCAAVEACDKG